MMSGANNHGQDHSLYQHLQGVSAGQTGPKLSLSFLGGQMGRSQTMSSQTYNGMEPPLSWLRPLNPRSELTQVVGRQGTINHQHLMSTDSKSGITSASANSSNSQEHDAQVFSPSSQNLIPRDIASPEWMLGSMAGQTPRTESNHFGNSSLNNLTGNGQLESGHPVMSLIDSPKEGDGGSNQAGQRGHTPVEFMQQHNTGADSGGDNNSRGGGSTVDSPDMKYPELQALRPYGGGPPSIYESHNNLMPGNFLYETMA